MGGSEIPKLPQAEAAGLGQYGLGNIQGGEALLGQIQQRMGQGLDPNVMNAWRNQGLGQIAGNFNAGKDQIGNMTNTSVAGKAGMLDKLYGGRASQLGQLETGIQTQDQSQRQQNFWGGASTIPGLSQTAYGIGAGKYGQELQRIGLNNQGLMNQYEMEKQGEFDWGGLLGSLLGVGGTVLSGGLMAGAMGGLGSMGAGKARGR
ncbi:hypothetical protein D4R20_03200 [bacterium]|nr:MAG: hypothetical protein D4R20_03200 [bacterium]